MLFLFVKMTKQACFRKCETAYAVRLQKKTLLLCYYAKEEWDQTTGLDETTFCETETRPRPGLIEISRPRQDRDFYKMIFRDRDEKFGRRNARNGEQDKNFLMNFSKLYSENMRLETRIFYKPFIETETSAK